MAIKVTETHVSYVTPYQSSGRDYTPDAIDDFAALDVSDQSDLHIGVVIWIDATVSGERQFEPGGTTFYQRTSYNSSYFTLWSTHFVRMGIIASFAGNIGEDLWRVETGSTGIEAGDAFMIGIKGGGALQDNLMGMGYESQNNQYTSELFHDFGGIYGHDQPYASAQGVKPRSGTWSADNSDDLTSPEIFVDTPGDMIMVTLTAFADDAWANDIVAATGYSAWTQAGYLFNPWGGASAASRRHHAVVFYRVIEEAGLYDLEMETSGGDASTSDRVYGSIQVIRQPRRGVNYNRQRHIQMDEQVDRGSWTGEGAETTNLHTHVACADGTRPPLSVYEITSVTTAARRVGGTASGNVAVAQVFSSTSTLFSQATRLRFRARTVGHANQILEVRLHEDISVVPGPTSSGSVDDEAYRIPIIGSTYAEYEVVFGAMNCSANEDFIIEFDRPSGMREMVGDDTNYIEIEVADESADTDSSLYYRTDDNDMTAWTEDTGQDVMLELFSSLVNNVNDSTYVVSEKIGGVANEFSSTMKFGVDTADITTPLNTDFGGVIKVKYESLNFTPEMASVEVRLAEDGVAITGWYDIWVNTHYDPTDIPWVPLSAADIASVTVWADVEVWIRCGTVNQHATENQLRVYSVELDLLGPTGTLPPDLITLKLSGDIAIGNWTDESAGTTNIYLSADNADDVSTTVYVESEDLKDLTADTPSTALRFALANPLGSDRWNGGVQLKVFSTSTARVSTDRLMIGLWEGTTPIWPYEPVPNNVEGRWVFDIPPEAVDEITNWNNLEVRAQVMTLDPTAGSARTFRIHGIGLNYLGELPPPGQKTHTTDALLAFIDVEVDHDTDALLQDVDIEVTHTTDALLQAVDIELDHTTDAFLKFLDLDVDHTTDAFLKFFDLIETHTADAFLQFQDVEVDHDTDALLIIEPQLIAPDEDISGTGWETAPTPAQDLFEQVNEEVASATDYIYWDN